MISISCNTGRIDRAQRHVVEGVVNKSIYPNYPCFDKFVRKRGTNASSDTTNLYHQMYPHNIKVHARVDTTYLVIDDILFPVDLTCQV